MKKKVGNIRKIIVLCAVVWIVFGITFAAGILIKPIDNSWLKFFASCAVYAIIAATALLGMKLSDMKIKPLFNFKNKKQYLFAIVLAVGLTLVIAVIPALLRNFVVDGHLEFNGIFLLKKAVYYIVFVGPAEELVFRAFAQDLLAELLPKAKWTSAVIAAALFGICHIINGEALQVYYAFTLGAVFGLTKHFCENCTYISVALGHGLYDFFNIIVRMFIIK